jgi:hypothetical protein
MTVPAQPLREITREAVAVLVRELGVARTLRFLGQFRTGQGDYTVERHRYFADLPSEELFDQARRLDQRVRNP